MIRYVLVSTKYLVLFNNIFNQKCEVFRYLVLVQNPLIRLHYISIFLPTVDGDAATLCTLSAAINSHT